MYILGRGALRAGFTALIAAAAIASPLRVPTVGAISTHSPSYRMVTLAPLAALGAHFSPVALGPDGTVLGYTERLIPGPTYGSTFSLVSRTHIYLLSAGGRLREIPQPHGVSDLAPTGMNGQGEIIGSTETDQTGYVYRDGTWRFVGLSGEGDPQAIDDHGRITGIMGVNDGNYAFLGDDHGHPLRTLATLRCGCATRGEALAPTGAVLGDASTDGGDWHAAIFPADGGPVRDLHTIHGAYESNIAAVNTAGVIAGTMTFSSGAHVMRYDGAMRDMGSIPGLPGLTVAGIDARGRIAGTASARQGPQRAFLVGAGGILDLTTLAGLSPGATVSGAVAMNASGQILALATFGHGHIPVLLTPTRADAGGPTDAYAAVSRVTPPPPPSPTPITTAPTALAGTWYWDGLYVPFGWPKVSTLNLGVGPGLALHGTIRAGRESYAVTGTFHGAYPDQAAPFNGGNATLTWAVPAKPGGPPAGLYGLRVEFRSDFQLAVGTYVIGAAVQSGNMSLKRSAPPVR